MTGADIHFRKVQVFNQAISLVTTGFTSFEKILRLEHRNQHKLLLQGFDYQSGLLWSVALNGEVYLPRQIFM
jgi:hypothetical protein